MSIKDLHINDIVKNDWYTTKDILLQVIDIDYNTNVAKCIPVNANARSFPEGVTDHHDGLWWYSDWHLTEVVGTAQDVINVEELI